MIGAPAERKDDAHTSRSVSMCCLSLAHRPVLHRSASLPAASSEPVGASEALMIIIIIIIITVINIIAIIRIIVTTIITSCYYYYYCYSYYYHYRARPDDYGVDTMKITDDDAAFILGNQDSSKGGAVETGCNDLYDVIY